MCSVLLYKALRSKDSFFSPSLSLSIFCAHWILQAYELNVTWQQASWERRCCWGLGGKNERRMWRRERVKEETVYVTGSSGGVWRLFLPRLRPTTNHMRCACSSNNLFLLPVALHRHTVWNSSIVAFDNQLFAAFPLPNLNEHKKWSRSIIYNSIKVHDVTIISKEQAVFWCWSLCKWLKEVFCSIILHFFMCFCGMFYRFFSGDKIKIPKLFFAFIVFTKCEQIWFTGSFLRALVIDWQVNEFLFSPGGKGRELLRGRCSKSKKGT